MCDFLGEGLGCRLSYGVIVSNGPYRMHGSKTRSYFMLAKALES